MLQTVLAGLSELYGRHIVLNLSNTFFCVWQIGCALAPSLNSLIAFRFLAGIGGSACMTLGGACISDLVRPPVNILLPTAETADF